MIHVSGLAPDDRASWEALFRDDKVADNPGFIKYQIMLARTDPRP